MGINDRDYMREPKASPKRKPPSMEPFVIGALVLIAVILLGRMMLNTISKLEANSPELDYLDYQLPKRVESRESEIEKLPEMPAKRGVPVTLKRLVNVNTATLEELESIPQISETVARAIIAHRPYTEYEELCEVPGIKAKRLQSIRPYIEK